MSEQDDAPVLPAPDEKRDSATATEPIVVGIGASAGGLRALKEFFDTVPADSGIAFVVVVHLSPDHESRHLFVSPAPAPSPLTTLSIHPSRSSAPLSTDDTIVHQGLLDPDVEFLQKRFTADALNRRVREVLDRAVVAEVRV